MGTTQVTVHGHASEICCVGNVADLTPKWFQWFSTHWTQLGDSVGNVKCKRLQITSYSVKSVMSNGTMYVTTSK